ncbi:MAG: hypothetical protein ACUVXI_11900 [bacterium]
MGCVKEVKTLKRYIAAIAIVSLISATLNIPALARDAGGENPEFALALSLITPGLGQVYAGEPGRGLFLFLGEGAAFVLGFALINWGFEDRLRERDVEVLGADGKRYTVRARPSMDAREVAKELGGGQIALIATGAALALGGLGLHIWGAIDAYNLARK